jgi:hypothetical protein
MSKIGKQQAINLFKFVSRVDVKFNPWGGDANVQAREFLRQMRSKAVCVVIDVHYRTA